MATPQVLFQFIYASISLLNIVISSDINGDSVTYVPFDKYEALLQKHEQLIQENNDNIR